MNEFMSELGISENYISRYDRLGKFDADKARNGKSRPLRVRFATIENKDEVMRSLKKLANAPESLKRISVKHDLSMNERQAVKEKIEEAKQKTADSDEFAYLVRGQPWNRKLIQVPKKE